METHKKKVVIIIFIILLVISLIAVALGLILGKNEDDPNNITNIKINDNIVSLTDPSIFFALQEVINNYYLSLTSKDASTVDLLDPDYIAMEGITSSNIFQIIKSDYEMTSYIPKNIYYNQDSNITYYFINGYLIDSPMMEGTSSIYENINYLVIKNKNNNYVLRPINNGSDITNILKNYPITYKNIKNNKKLDLHSISDEDKMTAYLNEFFNLMIVKPELAYNLLDNSCKEKYDGLEDFKQEILNIYNKYTTKIFALSKKSENNETVYYIKDDKQNDIVIYENRIMDYKIYY